jgi:hypothetical protein
MDHGTIVCLSRRLVVGVLVASMIGQLGCDAGRQFREAAMPMVEGGVKDIVNGLMDGFFAAIDVETTTQNSSST